MVCCVVGVFLIEVKIPSEHPLEIRRLSNPALPGIKQNREIRVTHHPPGPVWDFWEASKELEPQAFVVRYTVYSPRLQGALSTSSVPWITVNPQPVRGAFKKSIDL